MIEIEAFERDDESGLSLVTMTFGDPAQAKKFLELVNSGKLAHLGASNAIIVGKREENFQESISKRSSTKSTPER